MLAYILKRLFWGVVLICAVTWITFVIFTILPEERPGQATLGLATPNIQQQFDLEGSLPEQYVTYLANALRGDEPQAELKDAWIGYSELKSWDFRVGQFQEPFSLEELTSSRYITFMERALPNAFVPGYHLGASVHYQGKNWQATGGYFDRSIGPGDDDEGSGYAARVTAAPIHSKRRLLHVGASAAYRTPMTTPCAFGRDPRPD